MPKHFRSYGQIPNYWWPPKKTKQTKNNKSIGSKINFKLLSSVNFQIFQKQKKMTF